MLLTNIKFPIFIIGTYKRIWKEDNILYIESTSDIIYKLDNSNLPYDTLGKRRLHIPKKERYRFTNTFFTIGQLIKSGKKLFIDNTGKLIKYRKDRRVNLIYREIKKTKFVEGKGVLCYIKNISVPILISNYIYNDEKFIGLLSIDDGYLLYELSDYRKPDTWRKV